MSFLSKLFGGLFGGAPASTASGASAASAATLKAALATAGTPRFHVALAKGTASAVAGFANKVVESVPSGTVVDAVILTEIAGADGYRSQLRYGGLLVVLGSVSAPAPRGYLAVSSGPGFAVFRRV